MAWASWTLTGQNIPEVGETFQEVGKKYLSIRIKASVINNIFCIIDMLTLPLARKRQCLKPRNCSSLLSQEDDSLRHGTQNKSIFAAGQAGHSDYDISKN